MKEKMISGIMAGIFISIGAMTYLSIPNALLGSLFFSAGIFLVLNLHNMLVTRVCPLVVYEGGYCWQDILISWIGNGIGILIAAIVIGFSRFESVIHEPLRAIAETKLNDTPQSLFVLGVLCACLVAFAVLIGGRYERGTFAQIFYVWLFITAFVFCGFEHIVADMFYLACYALYFDADILSAVKVLFFVSAGNIAGGLLIAWVVRCLDGESSKENILDRGKSRETDL